MNEDKLLKKYLDYIKNIKTDDGKPYQKKYFYDKCSRLRTILKFIDADVLLGLNEKNYETVCDLFIENCKEYSKKEGNRVYKFYPNYFVVIRQIFTMNTNKKPKYHMYYGGKRR